MSFYGIQKISYNADKKLSSQKYIKEVEKSHLRNIIRNLIGICTGYSFL